MRKIILALACMASLFGCSYLSVITGSGNLVESQIGYSDFNTVSVSGPFDVTIEHSNSYDITIVADHNVMNHISVERNGDALTIELTPHYSFDDITLRAYVSMPSLKGVQLFGATTATVIDSASFPYRADFSADLSGASKLLMPSINAQTAQFILAGASSATAGLSAAASSLSVSGASTLKLSGVCGNIDAYVSGASELDMRDAVSADVDISINTASQATVNMSGRLDAVLGGASTLNYRGDVVLGSLDITGASQFTSY